MIDQPEWATFAAILFIKQFSMLVPKFSSTPHSFHSELKRRISDYFEEVGASTTGNYSLFVKAVILMASFIFIYIHLVFLPHLHSGLSWKVLF